MRAVSEHPSLGSALARRDLVLRVVVLLAVVAGVIYLFAPGLTRLGIRWQEPEYSHAPLIPLITLFLIWERRHRLRATRSEGAWLGVALLGVGLLLLLGGKIAMSDIPQALAFVLVLGGLGLAALGARAMLYLWVPLAFLLFALPMPAPAYVRLSIQLQLISSELGAGLLELLGISVFLDGNVIDLGVYQLQVAEACSGLRYLFPLASFGFLCAWLFRGPLWARGVLLLSVVPITVLMNSVRIALTGVLVEHGSIELAEGFLHLFEGWVIFVVAVALLFGEVWLLGRIAGNRAPRAALLDFDRLAGGRSPEAPTGATAPWRPGAAFAACLGLLVAAVPLQHGLKDRTEIIPERPGLVTFPLRFGDWEAQPRAIDRETLKALNADDYFLADFSAPGVTAPVNFWVAYYGSQGDRWPHSPKACLPGAGWEFVSLTETPAPSIGDGGPEFVLNRAVIANGDERILMYFWYDERGRQFTDGTWARYYLLVDSLTMRRSDGALVRLMTRIGPGEPVAAAEARLTDLFRRTYPHLEPHVGA